MMPVRAERGAGASDGEVSARDDPKRTMKRHRQHAAQRRQRSPDVRMLHEISEVFVSRKAKARSSAIDHGVHRVRIGPALV